MTQLEATPYQPPAPPSLGKIAGALAKAQGMMTGAKKDATNAHFRSKYATLEAVVDAIREPLSSNGIAYVQWFRSDGTKVTNYTMLIHAESGETLESGPASAEAKGKGPQEIISTVTYLRRAQLMAMCGIAPEDDDGETAQGRPAHQPAPKQATAQGNPPPASVIDAKGKADLMDATSAEIKRTGIAPADLARWAKEQGFPATRSQMTPEQLQAVLSHLKGLSDAA